MLKKFTEELKEQREKAGITLQNMAAKTRIDIKFLEALEDGNFNFLPEVYVKAFIKQYAKVVGLDEEETLQKYILAKEGKEEAVEKVKQEDTGEKKEDTDEQKTNSNLESNKTAKIFIDDSASKKSNEEDKKKQKQLIIGGSVIGVVLFLLLVFFLFINGSDDIIVEEKPYEEVFKLLCGKVPIFWGKPSDLNNDDYLELQEWCKNNCKIEYFKTPPGRTKNIRRWP